MSVTAARCRKHNRGDRRLPFYLIQYALDDAGARVRRQLTAAGDTIVKGPWEFIPRPFAPGLYCKHCLDEGIREPLPFDDLDLQDFGLLDRPIVFHKPDEVEVEELVKGLQAKFGDRITIHDMAARRAVYSDNTLLDRLHPSLRRALATKGILGEGGLYSFQVDAIEAALRGNDTVVTTPTASGKTLTYLLPVFDTLIRDPAATAIYISPLVALTEDQLESATRLDTSKTDWTRKGARFSIHRVCRTLELGTAKITVARYDGQVNEGDRLPIKEQRPQYVLTTPDMLHAAIMGGAFNERQWRYLLAGLRYVVIDELHSYRGVLGAAFANLLRRLRRICRILGAKPQFICASATMVDPARTVERFIGRKPIVIDGGKAGAPQHKRKFVLHNGGSGDGSANALSTHAKNILLHLLNERIRSIAFARSISEINDIYRFVVAELKENGQIEPMIKPFMRELLAEEKRAIISNLKEGRLAAVISTSALSMGIDIGQLSAAVIIGFPGSIAQLWQQAGRAGRSGEGLIILIADRNPLDQFFVQHPDELHNLNAEPVYLNQDNPYIVRSHLLRAAQEAALGPADIAEFGPSALEVAEDLRQDGLLIADTKGLLIPTTEGNSLANASFRNLTFAVPVLTSDRRQIVEVDAARAQRALHLFAHYQYIDHYYRVTRCDLNWKQGRGEIFVQEIEHPEYTTTAHVHRQVSVITAHETDNAPQYHSTYGLVRCHTTVDGYYKVPLFLRNEKFQFQPLGGAAPEPLTYETQAFWLSFAPEHLSLYPPEDQQAGLYSLAGAIKLATAIEELCDPSDIETLGFLSHPDTNQPTLMLYDSVPGGVGIAEAAFPRLKWVLLRAEQILVDCPYCSEHPESRGCPYCVTAQYGEESTINRHVAIEIVRALRFGNGS